MFYVESSISEQPSCAPQRATAAEQNLPLHTANLIVIIPRQLRTRLDAPGKDRRKEKWNKITFWIEHEKKQH